MEPGINVKDATGRWKATEAKIKASSYTHRSRTWGTAGIVMIAKTDAGGRSDCYKMKFKPTCNWRHGAAVSI